MRTVRGFHDGPLDGAQRVQLSEALSHHWTRVLRLQQGDEAQLFNGDGHDYRVRLLTLAKRGVEVEILGSAAVASESPWTSPSPRACVAARRWTGYCRRPRNSV